MITVALDASTYAGSVAVIRDGAVVAERTTAMRGEREERLMPAVAEVMREAGVVPGHLSAVACGAGPGSFTSLRIAASIAKGLAVARGIPLLTAPSQLLVVAGAAPPLSPGDYVVLLDAMRGDVFGLDVRVDSGGGITMRSAPWLATREHSLHHGRERAATPVGPAERLSHAPHARGFAALMHLRMCRTADAAMWEPDYGRKAEAQVRWEREHARPLEAS
jgi:tRNA threonylcarbamoyladenosine biosynthesis protein TsaB